MRVRILPSAMEDIRDGFAYYEEREKGLGSYFTEKAYTAIDQLAREAGIHSIHFGKFHRKLVRRFPFAIYYRLKEAEVGVYAVIDCRRSRRWIRQRLKKAVREP